MKKSMAQNNNDAFYKNLDHALLQQNKALKRLEKYILG